MPDSQTTPTPVELGNVRWTATLELAQTQAKQRQLPLFLLFQEIPGCATCTGFGRQVLAHPLLAAAIETSFVPVAVRNNVEGAEGKVRDAFAEPSWNNPVVRFLGADGKELLPRRDGIFDAHGIANRMIDALAAAKQPVPGYLRVARDESNPARAVAVFAMHCFWEGEAALGSLEGVVRTKSAFVGDAEVVEVTYLPAVLSSESLTKAAQAKSCRPVVATALRDAPVGDQQHALAGTPFAALTLSPMQRTRVHAALSLGTDPMVWLTPSQAEAVRAASKPSEAKR
jgi:hypothetical protein